MNDLMISVGIIAVSTIALIMFGIYSVYGGSKASLCDAKPGQVFNFDYMQPLNGDCRRILAKVLEKPYRFTDAELRQMDRRSSYRKDDKDFKRTNHLVICKTHDGEIRQFYCERAVNCRKPLLGSIIY
jgi:hypothetical protein